MHPRSATGSVYPIFEQIIEKPILYQSHLKLKNIFNPSLIGSFKTNQSRPVTNGGFELFSISGHPLDPDLMDDDIK
jgi:hypothetical protein